MGIGIQGKLQQKHRSKNIEIATNDFAMVREDVKKYLADLENYEAALEAAGAPYTKGRKFK